MIDVTLGRSTAIEPIYLSVKDAAKVLGISTYQMYELTRGAEPEVEVRWYGGKKLVLVSALKDYAARLPTEKPEPEDGAA